LKALNDETAKEQAANADAYQSALTAEHQAEYNLMTLEQQRVDVKKRLKEAENDYSAHLNKNSTIAIEDHTKILDLTKQLKDINAEVAKNADEAAKAKEKGFEEQIKIIELQAETADYADKASLDAIKFLHALEGQTDNLKLQLQIEKAIQTITDKRTKGILEYQKEHPGEMKEVGGEQVLTPAQKLYEEQRKAEAEKERQTTEDYLINPLRSGFQSVTYSALSGINQMWEQSSGFARTVLGQALEQIANTLLSRFAENAATGILSGLLSLVPGGGAVAAIGSAASGSASIAGIGSGSTRANFPVMNSISRSMQPSIQVVPIVSASGLSVMVKYGNQSRNDATRFQA
jgi:hypothetical protein